MERVVLSVLPKPVTPSAADGAAPPQPAATEKPMPAEDGKMPAAVPPKAPKAPQAKK
jgi:hypothetical protein